MHKFDSEIDITDEVCPMTFIRAKIQIEKMAVGEVLSIKLRGGEPLQNVPRAMLDHGHEIIDKLLVGDDLHQLIIRKCRQ